MMDDITFIELNVFTSVACGRARYLLGSRENSNPARAGGLGQGKLPDNGDQPLLSTCWLPCCLYYSIDTHLCKNEMYRPGPPSEAQHGANIHQLSIVIAATPGAASVPARS